jgi:hypothetical protein
MNARASLFLTGLVALAVLAVASTAGAGKGGPSPGVAIGGAGVTDGDGAVSYAARRAPGRTTVVALDSAGRRLRAGSIDGVFGVPLVAFDGSLGGLSFDGRRLVLASKKVLAGRSRFAVLSTRDLDLRRLIVLEGSWSYDALSPEGRRLYLVEHSRGVSYRVRAYDVIRGRLLKEAVIDPRQGCRAMSGMPVKRAHGPGGVWAYTLYTKPGGLPFVHALDTMRGTALCIELPWRGDQSRLFDLQMTVHGRTLDLRRPGGSSVATIDTREYVVHAHHNPLRTGAGG